MIRLVTIVAGCLLAACVTQGVDQTCHFPTSWGENYWLTHINVDGAAKNSLGLVSYEGVTAFTSTSLSPLDHIETYSCTEFDTTSQTPTFVRLSSAAAGSDTCVEEKFLEDSSIIAHKETAELSGDFTLGQCRAALDQVTLTSFYLPVRVTGTPPTLKLDQQAQCPFDNIPYLLTFSFESSGEVVEECLGDRSSVLSVTRDKISIIGCKYSNYPAIPLTGQLHCLADISPTAVGEEDSSNGGILLLKWVTATKDSDLLFCTRYKVLANKDVELSIDLDSSTPLSCQMNADYSLVGTHNNRNYVKFKFRFDAPLVTASVSPNMSPIATTPTPRHISSTDIPIQPSVNVQVALDHQLSAIENKAQFRADIKESLAQIGGIDADRVDFVSLDADSSGFAVVNAVVKDDGFPPPLSNVISNLNTAFRPGQDPLSDYAIKPDSFYTWRVSDRCPDEYCLNEGECWVSEGVFACRCKENYKQPYCETDIQPGTADNNGKERNIIIIVVCVLVGVALITGIIVFIIIRQRGAKKATAVPIDGESNAGYSTTMEDRDREMYSTINKKPKAFHEKSFSNLDSTDDHGELTGIHL